MGWWWPAAGLGALNVAVFAWDLLKEVAIIFATSTIVWSQVNMGEGNGNSLRCSCLENPRDRETWWAASYGVAQTSMTEET